MKARKTAIYIVDRCTYIVYGIIIAIIFTVFLFHVLVNLPYFQTMENLAWYRRFLYFDYMFLLFFSLSLSIAGCGLIVLGHGCANKLAGIGFLFTGLLVLVGGFYYFDVIFNRPMLASNVYEALAAVGGTVIGFLGALGVTFLVITHGFNRFKHKR